eukprot:scaffold37881_cov183-Amphora_coffeaeformis.AAC.2
MSNPNDDAETLLPIVFGYNGRDLFSAVNILAVAGWLPLWFLPRWKYTPYVPIVPVLFFAVMYTIALLIVSMDASTEVVDFSNFEGVHRLLSDPNAILPAWVHYCFADLLIGRWVFIDSVERGATLTFHYLVMSFGHFFLSKDRVRLQNKTK